jgi:hypothetical protein
MRPQLVFLLVLVLTAAATLASCTLITEVDRGLIGEGGAGGMGGAAP